MPASIPAALTAAAIIAAPSIATIGVYMATGDPLLRWLGITEARLAAADQHIASNDPYVRIRIYWRGPEAGYAAPADLVGALRGVFQVRGIDVQIAVLEGPGTGPTTLDMRAGINSFGPFKLAHTPRHVGAAVEAARLAHSAANTRL